MKGLRKLDKVIKERGKSHFVAEDQKNAFEDDDIVMEDEEHIYVAEGDLGIIYEEKDIQTAPASYREAREALKNQKLGRGYFPPKGRGKGGGKHRVHVEQLKLRTRCWKCSAIGHWGRECAHPEKSKLTGGPGSSASSTSSASAKSGFFVASHFSP